jgi:hypothetical protein
MRKLFEVTLDGMKKGEIELRISTASLVFICIERFGREGEGVCLWHGVVGCEVVDATCNKVVLGLRAYPGGGKL